MRGDSKCPMAINPAIGIGLAPCGLKIDAAKPFRDNAFLLLLFMPKMSLGFVHQFIGTDDRISAQDHKPDKKMNAAGFPMKWMIFLNAS